MSIHITFENFEEEVRKADRPVLVDFHAAWCGPCQMMAPVIEELEGSRDDLVVGKIDVDQERFLAQQFSITAVPTLLLFQDGEEVRRSSGFMDKASLERFLGGV